MNHCPNCGKEIKSSLMKCPYCSFPLPEWEKINDNRRINDLQENISYSEEKKESNNGSVEKKLETPRKTEVEHKRVEPIKKNESVKKVEEHPKKKSNKKNIFIIFLVLIALSLSGYIVYDKVFKKQTVKVKTETKEDLKLVTEYLLTDQEALGIGNYLWNYALDTVWCKNFKYSNEETDLGNNLKGFEITNYADVSQYFSKDFTYKYKDKDLKFNDIFENHTLNDKYYDINKCNKDKDLTYNKTVLKIRSNELYSVKYTATSIYCGDLQENEDCTDEKVTKTLDHDFEIFKENNIWKIDKFVVPN